MLRVRHWASGLHICDICWIFVRQRCRLPDGGRGEVFGGPVDTRAVLVIIVALGVGWALQLALAYRQAQSFNRRVRALTKLGRTAVGRAGSRVRGVVFAAIAADGAGNGRGAEILKGITVFAKPRPFPQLIGRDVDSLAHTESRKTTDLAIADAASHLLSAQDEGGEQTP